MPALFAELAPTSATGSGADRRCGRVNKFLLIYLALDIPSLDIGRLWPAFSSLGGDVLFSSARANLPNGNTRANFHPPGGARRYYPIDRVLAGGSSLTALERREV